jgi:hypothetical protein
MSKQCIILILIYYSHTYLPVNRPDAEMRPSLAVDQSPSSVADSKWRSSRRALVPHGYGLTGYLTFTDDE